MPFIKMTSIQEIVASRRRVRVAKRKRDREVASVSATALKERAKLLLQLHLTSAYNMEGVKFLGLGSTRRGNIHRDRSFILRWARQLDDVMFRRQFRLCREDFGYVVNKISAVLNVNRQQAINSSGSIDTHFGRHVTFGIAMDGMEYICVFCFFSILV